MAKQKTNKEKAPEVVVNGNLPEETIEELVEKVLAEENLPEETKIEVAPQVVEKPKDIEQTPESFEPVFLANHVWCEASNKMIRSGAYTPKTKAEYDLLAPLSVKSLFKPTMDVVSRK